MSARWTGVIRPAAGAALVRPAPRAERRLPAPGVVATPRAAGSSPARIAIDEVRVRVPAGAQGQAVQVVRAAFELVQHEWRGEVSARQLTEAQLSLDRLDEPRSARLLADRVLRALGSARGAEGEDHG